MPWLWRRVGEGIQEICCRRRYLGGGLGEMVLRSKGGMEEEGDMKEGVAVNKM